MADSLSKHASLFEGRGRAGFRVRAGRGSDFLFFLSGGSLGFRAVGVALSGPLSHNGSLLSAGHSSSNTERPMRYFYPGQSQNSHRTQVILSATSTQDTTGIISMLGARSGVPFP